MTYNVTIVCGYCGSSPDHTEPPKDIVAGRKAFPLAERKFSRISQHRTIKSAPVAFVRIPVPSQAIGAETIVLSMEFWQISQAAPTADAALNFQVSIIWQIG